MPTLIEELDKLLRRVQGLPLQIESTPEEMLVTMTVGQGRTQTVRVWTQPSKANGQFAIRFQSRACPARNHQVVRNALKTNAGADVSSFALDTTTNPPVIDVVYSLAAELVDFNEFLAALQQVGRH